MFIPVWLIVVLIVIAAFYVYAVKSTHKDNEHKIKSHLEGLRIEANYAETELARGFYDLAWKMVMYKRNHANDVLKMLREDRDYTSLAIGESFLYNPNEYLEDLKDVLKHVQQNTGFNFDAHKNDISISQYYEEEVIKYNDKINELRLAMDKVRSEIE